MQHIKNSLSLLVGIVEQGQILKYDFLLQAQQDRKDELRRRTKTVGKRKTRNSLPAT